MQTHLIRATGTLSKLDCERVEATLAAGGIVAFPTSSSYGLAVRIDDVEALGRLIELKEDRGHKPLALVLASTASVLRVAATLPPTFAPLAAQFWPGPLTLALAARPDLPPSITAAGVTVAVRVPRHPLARETARLAGGVATGTSANPSGRAPAQTAASLLDYFAGRIELVIDAGPTPGQPPSTILDLVASPPWVLRQGPVAAAAIEACLTAAAGGEGTGR